ncbi:MAG TPA: glycosyltransferase family 4 protein [Bacteroidales bacterium]|nr:glycosyltransferase family 4 protein [Bacteroidales bacterium]
MSEKFRPHIALIATSCFDTLLPLYKHLYNECNVDLYCFVCDRFMAHPSFDLTGYQAGKKTIESVPAEYLPEPAIRYLNRTARNVRTFVFRITLTSYATITYRIREIVNPDNYDVVHLIGSSVIYESFLRPLKRKYRLIVTIHEADPYRIKTSVFHPKELIKWAHNKILYSLINRADYITFFSLNEKQKFIHDFPESRGRCGIIKFGLQETFMHYDPVACGNSPGHDFILYTGMIRQYKGVEFLIESIRKSEKLSKIIFIIAGRDDVGLDIIELPNVTIINKFLSENEINFLVSQSRALILPYTGASQSGIPGIAFMHFKPVIFSDVRGLDEYLCDGYNGISFMSGNSKSLENAILKIYDPEVYNSLLNNIKMNPYTEDLSWKTLAGRYAEVYEKILKNETKNKHYNTML